MRKQGILLTLLIPFILSSCSSAKSVSKEEFLERYEEALERRQQDSYRPQGIDYEMSMLNEDDNTIVLTSTTKIDLTDPNNMYYFGSANLMGLLKQETEIRFTGDGYRVTVYLNDELYGYDKYDATTCYEYIDSIRSEILDESLDFGVFDLTSMEENASLSFTFEGDNSIISLSSEEYGEGKLVFDKYFYMTELSAKQEFEGIMVNTSATCRYF